MSTVKKIIVCGFPGSAKSTFMRYLDGHPQILSTQLYERFGEIFTLGKEELLLLSKKMSKNVRLAASKCTFTLRMDGMDIEVHLALLKRMLMKYTAYPILEEDACNQNTYNSYSSSQHDTFDFKFNFEKFEELWKKELFQGGRVVTQEDFIDIMYKSFFASWEDYPVQYSDKKHISFVMTSLQPDIKLLFDNDFNHKFIFIDRDTEGVIVTKALRNKLVSKNEKQEKGLLINSFLKTKDAKYVAQQRAYIHLLAKTHDNILIVPFEKLILNTKEVMSEVTSFLNIEEDSHLSYPSHFRKKLEGEYTGKINDDWRSVLNNSQVGVIRYQAQQLNLKDLLFQHGFRSILKVIKIECVVLFSRIIRKLRFS